MAVAPRQENGRVREPRIVLGAATSAPRLAADASALPDGQELTVDAIDQAAVAARLGARPLDNTDLTNAWRRRMVEVYVIATCPIALVQDTRQPTQAQRFVDLVLSNVGQGILARYGFQPVR